MVGRAYPTSHLDGRSGDYPTQRSRAKPERGKRVSMAKTSFRSKTKRLIRASKDDIARRQFRRRISGRRIVSSVHSKVTLSRFCSFLNSLTRHTNLRSYYIINVKLRTKICRRLYIFHRLLNFFTRNCMCVWRDGNNLVPTVLARIRKYDRVMTRVYPRSITHSYACRQINLYYKFLVHIIRNS